jgi:hypothetical protein
MLVKKTEAAMALGWVILGVVAVVLMLVFALVQIVRKIAREREAARRRRHVAMQPLAEDTTITYAGHS